jgi:hypothetical protein
MREVVANRHIPQTTSMMPDKRASEEARPPDGGGTASVTQPPGLRWVDQLCDDADRRDRAEATRVRVNTELAEAVFNSKGAQGVRSSYEPFSRERMGFSADDE